MSVVAVVTKLAEVERVVRFSLQLALAYDSSLTVLCWDYSPAIGSPGAENVASVQTTGSATTDELEARVRQVAGIAADNTVDQGAASRLQNFDVKPLVHSDLTTATLENIRQHEPEFLVMAGEDLADPRKWMHRTNPLFRQSPCTTVAVYPGAHEPRAESRLLVLANDSSHDAAMTAMAVRLATHGETRTTIARIEEGGEEAIEVGRRELRQLMRAANAKRHDHVRRRVLLLDDRESLTREFQDNDFVLVAAPAPEGPFQVLQGVVGPSVAIVKRAPPLRWGRRPHDVRWRPRLSPADYADLVHTLRHGSKLNADFLVMLGLAAAIASWGLLQDSAAVVIGSMLLAPLMTPMIAIGLALAQGNPTFGRKSMASVLVGFVVALCISLLIGLLTPGLEITLQVLARGAPNLIDLCIALGSGAAAAYALARPSLVGAVAGVAIATALVPPLCSMGISITYHDFANAQGAGLMFITNLVAIILGAAATFRTLGVVPLKTTHGQRRWVIRVVGVLAVSVIILAFPLQSALRHSLELGKPQPRTFPLAKGVEDALAAYIARNPQIELIASGRPSSPDDPADVIIVLASPEPMPAKYGDSVAAIVRQYMGDESLIVKVHCLLEAWEVETPPDPASAPGETPPDASPASD